MVLKDNFKHRITFLFLIFGTLFASIHGQNVEKMIRKEVQVLWENSGEIAQIQLSQDFASSCDDIHDGDLVYSIPNMADGSIIGYVLTTSAMGRFDAFDYFIIYNKELKVQSVRVVVYRSSHGSAICNKRWLKQFEGFGGETIVYGKDIQAVSGATISGGSIVEDVRRASKLMEILKEEQVF